MIILTILLFLLLLSLLVLIHEFGHFWVAKKLGIKVEEFGFGFPPKVWGIRKGETLYTINLLPIGGFVKLYGEDEVGGGRINIKNQISNIKNDLDRAFFTRPAWQRASIIIAGVVMNFFLAVFIYYVFLGLSGFKTEIPLLAEHTFFGVNQSKRADVIIPPIPEGKDLGEVIAKGSPAEKAGIKPASRVVSINNSPIASQDKFIKTINDNKGKEILITLEDVQTKKQYDVAVTPRLNPPKNEGALGIRFSIIEMAVLSYDTLTQRVFSGVSHPLNLMAYNLSMVGKLISVSFQEKTAEPISQGVAGPVGIVSLVNLIVQIPDFKEVVLQILNLAGILSISLAFFNILPIPALDGGRLFFVLVELVTGRKVNTRFESIAHAVGFAVLIALIILVTFNDISKLIPGLR